MKRTLSWLLFSLSFAQAEDALAYCGATTCGALPDDECGMDARGCPADGAPLGWPLESSVSIVCTSGCDDLVREALSGAVQSWQETSCEGLSSGISLAQDETLTEGQEEGFVLVEVVSEDWPYGSTVVGRTTLEFGITSGTLFRATIGLNAQDFVLGLDTTGDEVDVQAVLTHELGHALGLGHSSVSGATMQAEADIGYIPELRTLDEDDQAGLCALYPPDPSDAGAGGEGGGPGPNTQSDGGCTLGHPESNAGGSWKLAGLLLLTLSRLRRRSARP